MHQFDVEGLQLGCEGSSALFLSMWKQNWALMAQYCLPSLSSVLASYLILHILVGIRRKALRNKFTAGDVDVRQLAHALRVSAMLRTSKQWAQRRLEVATFTLIDLVYLNICTLTIKAFLCVNSEGSSYRLHAERSQVCWSHDHLPVALFSIAIYPLLLYYPVFTYNHIRDRLEARTTDGQNGKARGPTSPGHKTGDLKAGGLSGASLRDEYMPIGVAYTSVFRHSLAIFVSVPLPSSQYRLILACLPLLFVGLQVVKRPFKKRWMNACMPVQPAVPCPSLSSVHDVACGLRQGMR